MTSRTSNPPGGPASNRASQTIGAGTLGRPVTKLLTIDEAAEVLNVSPRTVRRLIESRALPAHRLGRLVRISSPDLAAFLAATRSI
jgi:excisionase family DNA binding protein